jgi:hypothetical protein
MLLPSWDDSSSHEEMRPGATLYQWFRAYETVRVRRTRPSWVRTALTAPYGVLPRKCSFIYLAMIQYSLALANEAEERKGDDAQRKRGIQRCTSKDVERGD